MLVTFAGQIQSTFKVIVKCLLFTIMLMPFTHVVDAAVWIAGGTIKGVVTDALTGETLIGVNVQITGTSKGGSTDIDGRFTIPNLEPGTYSISASMISFETQVIENILVKEGETTTVNISLTESSTQLEELVVVGDPVFGSSRVIHTDEMSMISKIKDSDLNITGISTQQIIRSVDNNAADLVKRAASVSVIDDFVTIRGLYERYNFTFINGMQAPSSKPDGRAFSFDLIPSSMIDNIVVYRSPAPELPADFAGGVVDISTRQSLPEKQLEFSGSAHYRQGTTFDPHYFTNYGSKTDKLGFDDGSRALPGGFPDQLRLITNNRSTTPRIRQLNGIAATEALLPQTVYSGSAKPDYRFGMNYYDSWRIGNMRLSTATSLNYTSTTAVRTQKTNIAFRTEVQPDNSAIVELGESYNDTIATINHRLSGFQSFNLRINPNNTILLNVFANQDGTDQTVVRSGYNFNTVSAKDFWPTDYIHQVNYKYNSRTVISTFLKGIHKLPSGKDELTWLGGYSYSLDDLPAERRMVYFSDSSRSQYTVLLDANDFRVGVSSRYARKIEEGVLTARADYKRVFQESFYLKTGIYSEARNRTFDSRFFFLDAVLNADTQIPGVANYSFPIRNKADSLLNIWVKEDGTGMSLQPQFLYTIKFNSQTNLVAGYAGVNIPLLNKKLTIYTGLRYELFDQQIVPVGVDSTFTETRKNFIAPDTRTTNILPSVNIAFSIKESLKLRGSFGTTINRPHEREISGVSTFDFLQGYSLKGSPNVVQAVIQNADLRLESYGGSGEIIAFGVFYKHFDKPIELQAENLPKDPLNGDLFPESYITSNTKSARNYGVELEARKNLAFIHPKLEPFSVILNGSLLKSEIVLSDSLYIPRFEIQYDSVVYSAQANAKGVKRSLTGTSPYLLNASLYYDNKKTGTTIAIQYNLFGPRIIIPPVIQVLNAQVPGAPPGEFAVQEFFSPGIYEDQRHLVDLTIRQKITSHIGFKFGIQNLLNAPVRMFADMNRDEKYTQASKELSNPSEVLTQDIERMKYYDGRYITCGLSFLF